MCKSSMILPALLTWIACAPAFPAAAQQQTTRIGGLEIRYDPSQWKLATPSADTALLSPAGSIAGKHDAVRIVRREGDSIAACARAAREQWPATLYDKPRVSTASVGGHNWQRIEVHTRCRNATPTGIMLCAEHVGSLYSLTVLNRISGCRNFNGILFPDRSLIDNLIAGLSFPP